MIQLQKWFCTLDLCNTFVYVEGHYLVPPCCPECGNDDIETMQEIGTYNFEEVTE